MDCRGFVFSAAIEPVNINDLDFRFKSRRNPTHIVIRTKNLTDSGNHRSADIFTTSSATCSGPIRPVVRHWGRWWSYQRYDAPVERQPLSSRSVRPTSVRTSAGSAVHRLQPSTAIVRMRSTAMTPIAMLVRGHISSRCCTLWRRRPLLIRLGHRQILRHCNGRQCADDQGAAYKSDIHARLRVLLRIRMPMLSVHSSTRWPRDRSLRERVDTGPCSYHDRPSPTSRQFH
jgi:hypothetical protein